MNTPAAFLSILLFAQHLWASVSSSAEAIKWCKDINDTSSKTILATALPTSQFVTQLPDALKMTSNHPIAIDRQALLMMSPEHKQMFDYINEDILNITAETFITFSSAYSFYTFVKFTRYWMNMHKGSATYQRDLVNVIRDNRIDTIAIGVPASLESWYSRWETYFLAQNVQAPTAADLEFVLRLKAHQHSSVMSALRGLGTKALINVDSSDSAMGMTYNTSARSYTGQNGLGKAWMYVKNEPISLCVVDWFKDLSSTLPLRLNQSDFPSNKAMLALGYMNRSAASSRPEIVNEFSALNPLHHADNGLIWISISDPNIPFELRPVFSAGNPYLDGQQRLSFRSIKNLYEFVRMARTIVDSRLPPSKAFENNVYGGGMFEAVRADECWPQDAQFWTNGFRGNRNIKSFLPASDLEWIMRLVFKTQRLKDLLLQTEGKLLIWGNLVSDSKLGMVYEESTRMLEGKNLYGKVLYKLREEFLAERQTQTSQSTSNTTVRPQAQTRNQQAQNSSSITSTQGTSTTASLSSSLFGNAARNTQSQTSTNSSSTARSFFESSIAQSTQPQSSAASQSQGSTQADRSFFGNTAAQSQTARSQQPTARTVQSSTTTASMSSASPSNSSSPTRPNNTSSTNLAPQSSNTTASQTTSSFLNNPQVAQAAATLEQARENLRLQEETTRAGMARYGLNLDGTSITTTSSTQPAVRQTQTAQSTVRQNQTAQSTARQNQTAQRPAASTQSTQSAPSRHAQTTQRPDARQQAIDALNARVARLEQELEEVKRELRALQA